MIVAVNKPVGWTSFDVVKKIRRLTGEKKVGHGGTLDPFAEGVLVVGIGRVSTRYLGRIINSSKIYEATLALGKATDTLDLCGQIIRKAPIPVLTKIQVDNVLSQFLGQQLQTPPMYSAKKYNGQRLYKLARRNETVPRDAVTVTIDRINLLLLRKRSIRFRVSCSKGTYIRQLGADIANKLNTVGYLTSLKRVGVGDYLLKDCISFSEIEEKWMSTVI